MECCESVAGTSFSLTWLRSGSTSGRLSSSLSGTVPAATGSLADPTASVGEPMIAPPRVVSVHILWYLIQGCTIARWSAKRIPFGLYRLVFSTTSQSPTGVQNWGRIPLFGQRDRVRCNGTSGIYALSQKFKSHRWLHDSSPGRITLSERAHPRESKGFSWSCRRVGTATCSSALTALITPGLPLTWWNGSGSTTRGAGRNTQEAADRFG